MRFISMHKADKNSEAGIPPSPALIGAMGTLMQSMAQAGVLVGGEGLQPSSMSVRLEFSGGGRTVTRGPLTGSNELIASFTMLRMRSLEDAIDWASRLAEILAGNPGDVEIDIGQVKEPWDLDLCPKPEGQLTRFLILQKADRNSETGVRPSQTQVRELQRLREDAVRAGTFLSAERLLPSSTGVRLNFAGENCSVTDGPFTESKELIGGYCMMRVNSPQEAIEWITRFAEVLRTEVPRELEIDLRPLHEEL